MKDVADTSSSPVIVLVGPLAFQNELVAYSLRTKLGATCKVLRHDCKKLAGVFRLCAESGLQPSLVLIDTGVAGYPLDSRGVFASAERPLCPVALMNLESGTAVEKQAMAAGYRGFFYRTDPLDTFVRGVRAVIGGEVWVSRDVLLNVLTGKSISEDTDMTSDARLSPREIEVLALVAAGAANVEIADMLSVSPNTIKTHLYNIFKKLGVANRLQAALWAAKNL